MKTNFTVVRRARISVFAAFCLFFSSMMMFPFLAVAAGQSRQILSNVPMDSGSLLVADYGKLKQSRFFEQIRASMPEETKKELEQYVEKLQNAGISVNPGRIILFAGDLLSDTTDGGVLLESSVTAAQIEKFLRDNHLVGEPSASFQILSVEGRKTFVLNPAALTSGLDTGVVLPPASPDSLSITPMENGQILLTDKAHLPAILQSPKGNPGKLGEALGILDMDSMIYGVIVSEKLAAYGRKLDPGMAGGGGSGGTASFNGASLAGGIKALFFWGNLTGEDLSGIEGNLVLVAGDSETAARSVAMLQQSFLILMMALGQDPESQELSTQLLSAVSIFGKENLIQIRVNFPEELLKKIVRLAESALPQNFGGDVMEPLSAPLPSSTAPVKAVAPAGEAGKK